MHRLPPRSTRTVTLFPYPTLFRSEVIAQLRGGLLQKVAAVMATTCRTAPGWTGPGDADDGAVLLGDGDRHGGCVRTEEHTYELQSLMRNSYAVICLNKKIHTTKNISNNINNCH